MFVPGVTFAKYRSQIYTNSVQGNCSSSEGVTFYPGIQLASEHDGSRGRNYFCEVHAKCKYILRCSRLKD